MGKSKKARQKVKKKEQREG